MELKYLLLISLFISHSLLYCITYIVNQDGTGDYITIQQAINHSVSGDIIIVHPGIYNENLLISKKSITLQSLYATDPDLEYIHNTIIRGSRNMSAIRVQARTGTTDSIVHTNVTIDGFTIMNDRYNYYIVSEGGGINFTLSGGTIKNNIIKNCTALYAGGGIYLDGGMLAPQSFYTDVHLEYNMIYDNFAYKGGGGMFVAYRNNLTFSQNNRNSIFDNISSDGRDILFGWAASDTTIYLDMGSRIITQLDYFFIGNQQHTYDYEITTAFPLDILQESIPRIEGNEIYVSPDGDDSNSGLSWDSPLKSLDRAACLMAYPTAEFRTIYLSPGIYSQETGTKFPISLPKNVNLIGAGENMTIFDGGGEPLMISIKRPFTNNKISSMTIKNYSGGNNVGIVELYGGTYHVDNIKFTNNGTQWAIFGRFVNDLFLENIVIMDSNSASFYFEQIENIQMSNIIINNLYDNWTWGPNIWFAHIQNIVVNYLSITNCYNTDHQKILSASWRSENPPDEIGHYIFNNVLFANNVGYGNPQWMEYEPLIKLNSYSIILLSNWTIVNNVGAQNSLAASNRAFTSINNSIFYNPDINGPNEISGANEIYNTLIFKATPMEGGWYYPQAVESLLAVSPEFVGMFDETITPDMPEYYQLHETSPCIDSGMEDVSHLGLPAMDLAGNQRIWNNRIDMGAFEFGSEPYVSIKDPIVPPVLGFHLTNYPNPFNPSTTISFTLSHSENITLNIYNIKGQLVRTLLNDKKEAGRYSIIWDGVDEKKNNVSSGIYFYRLETSCKTETKKMLLMK